MFLSLSETFSSLFTNIVNEWYILVLLIMGFVFCIIEGFVPGFGVFGILGMLMEVAGVVTYAILNNNIVHIVILLLIVLLVFLILFFIFVRSARYGILSKTPLIENETAVSTDYVKKERDTLNHLIGKQGIAITDCRPTGMVKISDFQCEVRARNKIIRKGDTVEVVEIDEDNKIVVDKYNK